jgi:hypothetical protein
MQGVVELVADVALDRLDGASFEGPVQPDASQQSAHGRDRLHNSAALVEAVLVDPAGARSLLP